MEQVSPEERTAERTHEKGRSCASKPPAQESTATDMSYTEPFTVLCSLWTSLVSFCHRVIAVSESRRSEREGPVNCQILWPPDSPVCFAAAGCSWSMQALGLGGRGLAGCAIPHGQCSRSLLDVAGPSKAKAIASMYWQLVSRGCKTSEHRSNSSVHALRQSHCAAVTLKSQSGSAHCRGGVRLSRSDGASAQRTWDKTREESESEYSES